MPILKENLECCTINYRTMNQENKTPHNFCETPEEKCTMNYCDENGCQNRKRHLVGENKQLPTASQSLCKWNFKLVHGDMVKCIEEHTRLHTAPLREELEKLRADKESLLVRVEEVREINKQLEHEMLLVKRNNKDLEAENERLKNIISGYESSLKDYDVERKHLINQNQRLREVLVKIVEFTEGSTTKPGQYVNRIAKEELKGGSDE
jgi:FtsZ-binding cell division protein ZapB